MLKQSILRSTLKGKNLLPLGANSFLLEQIPFQKERKTNPHKLPASPSTPSPSYIGVCVCVCVCVCVVCARARTRARVCVRACDANLSNVKSFENVCGHGFFTRQRQRIAFSCDTSQ